MSIGTGLAIAGIWLGLGLTFIGFGLQAHPAWEVTLTILGIGAALSVALALLAPSRGA